MCHGGKPTDHGARRLLVVLPGRAGTTPLYQCSNFLTSTSQLLETLKRVIANLLTMVASAVFITDLSGKSIISRDYRGDVPLNKAIDRFARYLDETPEEQRKPVFHTDRHGDAFCVEGDVGASGPGGENFVYVNVRAVVLSCR